MHNEGMDMDPGADSSPLHDVNTIVHFTPNITNIILYYIMTSDDAIIDILADDDNTVTDDMNMDVNVDVVHVYIHGHDPKGRGNPSSTREPGGIRQGTGDGRHWVLFLAHDTDRVHT